MVRHEITYEIRLNLPFLRSSLFHNSLKLQSLSPDFVICIGTCECQLFFRGHLSVHCRFIYYEQICVIKKRTNSYGKNEASKMSSDFNKLNKNVFTDKTQKNAGHGTR